MKKTIVIIGAVFLIIFAALAAIPFIFKDKIKEAVDAGIAESVNADVSYSNFDLSLIRSFPYLNVSVDKIGVVGQDLFLGDTLVYADQVSLKLNLKSIFFGDQIVVSGINLVNPKLLIKILDDGTANYDIAVASDSSSSAEEGSYNLHINQWTAQNASLIYDDKQTKFYLELDNLTHQGSGDFTEDIFDLNTVSQGKISSVQYDGVEYINDKQLSGEVTLEVDLPKSKYTFKENDVSINEFAFGFDGWLELPENTEDINMDITFEAQRNDFQSLLSCVPGMYTDAFKNITSDGQVQMSGRVKGTYNHSQLPAFQLNLKVADGMFKYPDLPTAVENINLEMLVANEDGNIDHTLIDISKMHLDLGQNPIDGRIRIDGLQKSEVDADVKAAINLGELNQMLPLEGTTLRGQYDLALKIQGLYDSVANRFPKVDASMKLQNGYVKSDQFPEALDQFNFVSTVTNPSGVMSDTRINIPDFSFLMDGEQFAGNLVMQNLSDYQWDLKINGTLDLEKMTNIFPLEGMALKGIIKGDLATKGKLSDLEAERYELLPTSGNVTISDFTYQSEDLTYPFHINSGQANFDPQRISINQLDARTGSSDMQITGNLTNYIKYVFKENEVVKGQLNLASGNLNLNEWMTETTDTAASAPTEIIEIPNNIDLDINAKIGRVHYDNMTLENVSGTVEITRGVAEMKGVNFNSLGGKFAMGGRYDTRDTKHPKFDLNMSIADVGIKSAFNTFNTVKILAPAAKLVDGNFSSDFNLSGELGQDMMPLLNTLSGGGLVKILEAVLAGADSKLVQGLSNFTQFSEKPRQFSLKDVIMHIQIVDGKLNVKPFDVAFGDYQTKISGSTGIDGSLEFLLNLDVPAGVVGSSVNQAIAKLTGSNQPTSDMVKLNIKLGGTYSAPTFALGGRGSGETTASLARDAAKQKVGEAKDSVRTIADQKTEKLKESGKARLDSLIDSKLSDSTSNQNLKNVKENLIKNKSTDDVLNLFKRKKKESDTTQNSTN